MIENLKEVLRFIGDDPDREGLKETPRRIMRSWGKLFGGYEQSAKEVLKVKFTESGNYDEMVALKNIELYSTCEHHFLPFYGSCHIAYLPDKGVVGISKLARLVEVFSRRLQIQERLTSQIADSIMEHLQAKGAGVIIEAQHFCMTSRGVEKQKSIMVTSALRGSFIEDRVRSEFQRLIKG